MPKNTKKDAIINDLNEDLLLQKDIALKHNVSVGYVSQVKKDINKIDADLWLKFLYNFMNEYMQPNNKKPSDSLLDKIGKIGDILDVFKR